MNFSSQRLLLAFATATLLTAAGCSHSAPSKPPAAPTPNVSTPTVGGENIVKLERTPSTSSTQPQFLSATLLPGRGMNVFQITANIPGKGVVHLLASPSVEQAATVLNNNGQGPGQGDYEGNSSFSFGGAFLVPYPNRIVGKVSADGKTITTEWHGKKIVLPANWKGKKPDAKLCAMHGLILATKVENVKTQRTADGETATGIIHAGNFGGHWLSNTDLSFTIALSGPAFEATVTAKNVGHEDEPMSIGWHPYFAILSGDRTQARIQIPAEKMAKVNNYDDVFPTGKLVPIKGTKYDFNVPGGKALGNMYLDDNFSTLHRTHGAVVVNFIDPASNYGIHIDGLSPEIKTVQVYAPPTHSYTAIEEQFNFNDPFGKEWHGMDTGMVTLKPGQSVTWKVRLELFIPPKRK